MAMEGQSVSSIKGTRMRVETTMSGQAVAMMPNAEPGKPVKRVTIVDAARRQMTVLDEATKTATIYDLSKIAGQMQQAGGPSDVKVSMTPTGQRRQILGRTCAEYRLAVTMAVTPPMGGGPSMTITLGGPTWIAKDAPGTAEFAAFYKSAGESGLFFEPGGGGANNPQARGMAAMYSALADTGGIPYEQVIQVNMEAADSQMADMMRQAGRPSTTMTVTGVSTDPIPDELFAVPAGYTTKKQ